MKIETYLNNPNRTIAEGLEILWEFTKNVHIRNYILSRQDQKKLDTELAVYLEAKTEIREASEAPETVQEPEPQEDLLQTELNKIWIERAKLSNQLADTPDQLLQEKVNEIRAKTDQYNQLDKKLKNIQNGIQEKEEEPKPDLVEKVINPDLAVIRAQMQPLREKISKIKKKLEAIPTHKNAKEWATEKAQCESLLENLEMKRKILEGN